MVKQITKSKRRTNGILSQELFAFVTVLLGCFNLFSFNQLSTDESPAPGLPRNETLKSFSSTKNIPFQLWKQYRNWHSQEALEREYQQLGGSDPDRKFSIVYYSCPHQAGNRMRNFAESMIWSILTNRTALWKYYSDSECKRVGKDFSPIYCQGSYNISVCRNVLARSALLPSFTEWNSKMRLAKHHPRILRHWVTHPLPLNITHHEDLTLLPRYYSYPEALTDNGIVDTLNETVVVFPFSFLDSVSNLAVPEIREQILHTKVARDRAVALLTEPHQYIYGLVRHENFKIQPYYEIPPQRPTLHSWKMEPSGLWNLDRIRTGLTVVVHSRHMKTTNDGSNIHHELNCLQPILSNLTKDDYCQLVLLSDREATVLAMQEYANNTFPLCYTSVVHRSQKQQSTQSEVNEKNSRQALYWDEHGPHAGAGFFQDMSLVANQLRYVPTTRTAFVAAGRSSNFLVEDTIHYELYRRHGHRLGYSPCLERCLLGGSRDEF